MTKIKPSDIKILEGKERYVTANFSKKIADQKINDVNPLMPIYRLEDINQRLSKLLNILEEPIDISTIPAIILDEEEILLYKKGFRDGEEAHKKKVREACLGKQNGLKN